MSGGISRRGNNPLMVTQVYKSHYIAMQLIAKWPCESSPAREKYLGEE